jgi:hypothetical protein
MATKKISVNVSRNSIERQLLLERGGIGNNWFFPPSCCYAAPAEACGGTTFLDKAKVHVLRLPHPLLGGGAGSPGQFSQRQILDTKFSTAAAAAAAA